MNMERKDIQELLQKKLLKIEKLNLSKTMNYQILLKNVSQKNLFKKKIHPATKTFQAIKNICK